MPSKYREVRSQFRQAIRSNRIIPQPCVVCGSPKTDGHHEDYSKPLDVIWLCRKHHAARHRNLYIGHIPKSRKLSESQVHAIRLDARSLRSIGKQYGISYRTVHQIKSGETWLRSATLAQSMPNGLIT